MGSVDLSLGSAPPPAPSPLYSKPLLHDSDTTLKALPEIKHVMRVPDTRPPFIVSFAFMGAVLVRLSLRTALPTCIKVLMVYTLSQVPLFVFLGYAAKLGVNFHKLFNGSIFVFGVVFLGSLSAILSLFAFYWLEFTLFQTLGYLAVLGSVNIWSGHLLLKRLAAKAVGGKKTKKE